MKVAFYLAHPAHYHLFKHAITALAKSGIKVLVLYNEKDVLHTLVKEFEKENIKTKKVWATKNVHSGLKLKLQFIQKLIGAFWHLLWFGPNLVIGTPVLIALVGQLIRYKSIIVNEDDFDIVKQTANLGYPYASHIICPEVCRTGVFERKCIKYSGYHELAYLHPSHFIPDETVPAKYGIDTKIPYAIIRFAKLTAHHDNNIRGINAEAANILIEILQGQMQVIITAERQIEPELEKYRTAVDPIDMHHLMAFASIYIGDSQTMAAEAGVLGVPFIRFNDFVGRISYLDELENKYHLGYGILPDDKEGMLQQAKKLVEMPERKEVFQQRRQKMLNDKINTANFLVWFIKNYPKSVDILKENPRYQNQFKDDI